MRGLVGNVETHDANGMTRCVWESTRLGVCVWPDGTVEDSVPRLL
ncbi:hypothetical protein RESH_01608 [Rhodopirellula europaea SH398]|uniref:Uncharacterized protein n=1 Tax=Rhodopirellula europaea SH398 TaxID=1263868 RepID=M5SJ57_9BACT|nr:hypothetical protein RESH_01608 [Rhodopirellula europaea SH398]